MSISKKQDPDLKDMSLSRLRREVMKLRTAFRKELAGTGNRRCWITLLQALPEGKSIKPLDLPRDQFLANCEQYHDRNQKKHDHSSIIHGRSHQTDKYPDGCMVVERPTLR